MMMPNAVMNRESRKILIELGQQADIYGFSCIVVPSHIYIADQIAIKYHTQPVINTIKSKLKGMKTRSSKHFTVEYWVTVLETMFSMNSSVMRDSNVMVGIPSKDNGVDSFCLIYNYLITDYSVLDAELIYNMVHKYDTNMIKNAINTAKKNGVYNVQYISAILEKEQALLDMKKREITKLANRTDNATSILNKEKVNNTIMDVAVAQHNWQQRIENAEIEERFNKLFE